MELNMDMSRDMNMDMGIYSMEQGRENSTGMGRV